MSRKPSRAEKNDVILIRQGVGKQAYSLPEGATVADLLQEAQAQGEGQYILIDGRPLEEFIALQSGMTITIVPKTRNTALDNRWQESIGMFKDDPTFEELCDSVEASREAEKDRS